MSAVLDQESIVANPPVGMEEEYRLTTGVTENIEATRYLFFAGNVIPKERTNERKDLARGGDEIASPCAYRFRGFLPRAMITPFERWKEDVPQEMIPQGTPTVGISKDGQTLSNHAVVRGVRTWPGEHIVSILHVPAPKRKGIVEIKGLFNVEWSTGEPLEVQRAVFPADWPLPKTLSGIRAQIEGVRRESSQLRSVADDMLTSCDQFYQWGMKQLDTAHTRLAQRMSHLHTYTYSPVHILLLEQLEVQRQDEGLNMLAKAQTTMMNGLSNAGITPEMLATMNEASMVRFEQMMQAQAAQNAQMLREILGTKPETVKPEGSKSEAKKKE